MCKCDGLRSLLFSTEYLKGHALLFFTVLLYFLLLYLTLWAQQKLFKCRHLLLFFGLEVNNAVSKLNKSAAVAVHHCDQFHCLPTCSLFFLPYEKFHKKTRQKIVWRCQWSCCQINIRLLSSQVEQNLMQFSSMHGNPVRIYPWRTDSVHQCQTLREGFQPNSVNHKEHMEHSIYVNEKSCEYSWAL